MAKFVITKPYTAKSRPIIFNEEMVRAILEGKKTQTRRVIKFMKPKGEGNVFNEAKIEMALMYSGNEFRFYDDTGCWTYTRKCPYGWFGDFLWVRETWATGKGNDFAKPSELPRGSIIFYKDGESKFEPPNWKDPERGKWRPSIFMPRWASRITLKITKIKVERVQDISTEDAVAEGISPNWEGDLKDWDQEKDGFLDQTWEGNHEDAYYYVDAISSFRSLWDSINAKRGYSWESAPWVWVIEFERVEDD